MTRFLTFLAFIGTFFMFSCATLNEQQCRTGNWEQIGRQDGARGYSASRVSSHHKACKEHGVQVNNAEYQRGYDAGVRGFCTSENGYLLGKQGYRTHQVTCPADLGTAFMTAMQKGFTEYQRELAAREAERKARELAALKASFFNVNSRGGVCDASQNAGVCFVFAGDNNAKPDIARGNQFMCRLFRGQYLPLGHCPEAQAIGRCDLVQGTPDAYHLFYYSTKRGNQNTAMQDCANPKSSLHTVGAGTWRGVPG
jgi:hypothetical protein